MAWMEQERREEEVQLSIRAIQLTSEWTRRGWRQESLRHVGDSSRWGLWNRHCECYQGVKKES